jgi:N-carbamoyl-L-amino-acid hydrolase
MPIRKDAGVAMMRLYHDVMERFPSLAGPRSVWTVGKMSVEPGAPAIIPGKAEMILQFRDAAPAVLQRMEAALLEIVAAHQERGPCTIECTNLSRTMPAPMEERLLDALDDAAEKHAAGLHTRMPSGAGHDAQILAQRLPSAMMFVPSIGGISHHFTENTEDADIVLGCQVFADAAAKILKGN